MAKYKKQIIMMFGMLTFIMYISISYFPKEEPLPVTSITHNEEALQIYVLDEEGIVVPLSISTPLDQTIEDKIKLMLGYMCGKQTIPGFYAFFEQECSINSIELNEGVLSLYFDEGFASYRPEEELRVLEAIAWGTTQFNDVKEVKLFYLDEELKEMPLAGTPIPQHLNRSIGINHFETSTGALHRSNTMTVFYTKKILNHSYLIPKSKRIENNNTNIEQKVDLIMKNISTSSSLEQPLYENNIKVYDVFYENGEIQVSLSKEALNSDLSVKEDMWHVLVLSLGMLDGVTQVEVLVDGKVVSPSNEDGTPVFYDTIDYNYISFDF